MYFSETTANGTKFTDFDIILYYFQSKPKSKGVSVIFKLSAEILPFKDFPSALAISN